VPDRRRAFLRSTDSMNVTMLARVSATEHTTASAVDASWNDTTTSGLNIMALPQPDAAKTAALRRRHLREPGINMATGATTPRPMVRTTAVVLRSEGSRILKPSGGGAAPSKVADTAEQTATTQVMTRSSTG